jgi:hypothetical protein
MFFSLSALKGNSTNTPPINYVCIDPLAQNYFEFLDHNAEMWPQSLFNPESSVYNQALASTYGVDNSTCIYDTNETCQSIDFPAGWSIFSTYIEDGNMEMQDVLTPLFNGCNLVMIKNFQGYVCLCGWPLCNLYFITNQNGYLVKLQEAQTINICGAQLTPEENPITISEGWSMISYLRTTPQNATETLSDIVEEIIIVKDSQGAVYMPSLNYNGIGDLKPGQGYQIKMNSEQTLIYDANED